jgi:uncharacterized membrane protein (DUF373 family)
VSACERFEHGVAFLLSLVIAMLMVVALIQLLVRVVPLLLTGALDPLDHQVCQGVFGSIMTVLIALLALNRKFVVLEVAAVEPAMVAALAGATLVLGLVYWLLRERDDRVARRRKSEAAE